MSKTPNHTPKPREFWIRPARPSLPFGACVDEPTMGGIHVIEYSALDHMAECFRVEQDKRLKAEKQLEQATAENAKLKADIEFRDLGAPPSANERVQMLTKERDELRAEVEFLREKEAAWRELSEVFLPEQRELRTACLDLAGVLSRCYTNSVSPTGTAHDAMLDSVLSAHQPLLQKLKEEVK